jgi:hypothetical protein
MRLLLSVVAIGNISAAMLSAPALSVFLEAP